MIKTLLTILIFLNFFSNCFSQIKTKIVLKIDNKVVTNFEIKNKILTELVLADIEVNQTNINNFKSQAVNSLINLKLKEIEIDKFNTYFSDADMSNYLKAVTKKDHNELKNIFSSNNLDFNLFLNEVRTEIKWKQFIYNTYSSKLDINLENIDKEIKNIIQNKSEIIELRLSELELLLDDVKDFEIKVSEIKKIIDEIGFESAATKFSTSESKINNGDLGWIEINSLSEEIYSNLKDLEKGDVSEPVIKGNTITLFKLVDKRNTKSKNLNKEQLKKNLIELKKNELFGMYANSHLSKLKNTSLIEYKK